VEAGRRAQYRVNVDETSDLQVALLLPDGSPTSGRLVDVSASGAGVRFLGPNVPSLAVGQEVDLVFASETLDPPLTVAAVVQHRTEEQGARRFGFRFLETPALESYLPPVLRTFFNRRRTVRVTPDPAQPVRVELRVNPGDAPLEAELVNISETGAAFSLEVGLDARLADITGLWITLYLPDARRPVSMFGDIRYRRLTGQGIHYGVCFDPEISPDFARKQGLIIKYVLKREIRLLRRSA
jgi:c-di-GMP-binding flagellar brake protein YcgR